MFKNLIPWKKSRDQIAVRRDEPTREETFENHPLIQMRQELDSLMNRFFDDQWLSSRMFNNFPALWDDSQTQWNWDLGWEDKGKEFVFQAELPGFEPDDFEVKVSGNLLTVQAEHKEETRGKNGGGYRYGSFTRTVTLPNGADVDGIDARYHSGILEVHVPKTADANTKRITVKST